MNPTATKIPGVNSQREEVSACDYQGDIKRGRGHLGLHVLQAGKPIRRLRRNRGVRDSSRQSQAVEQIPSIGSP
jgi:hypothetical protein